MSGTQDATLAKRFGELLVCEGRISSEILDRALELQGFNEKGLRLGGILLKWGLLREEEILDLLGRIHRCPFVGWKALSGADPEAVKLLSSAHAARLQVLPYGVDDRWLQVAFVNPSDLAAIDEVIAITKKRVKPAVAMEVRLLQAQQQFYGRPVSTGVWAVLQRLERWSKKRESGPQPLLGLDAFSETVPVRAISTRPELPDFTVPENWEPVVSMAAVPEPEPAALEEPETLESATEVKGAPDDPFSDQFSLKRFISDAIEFFDGLPNLMSDIYDEPVEDLDPSMVETAPLPRVPDPNATAPSRLRSRDPGPTPAPLAF
jgi:hypothetical protein